MPAIFKELNSLSEKLEYKLDILNMLLKPNDYNRAFNFFIEIPFYSIKDLILKKDLIINQKEITKIEKVFLNNKFVFYRIYFSNNNFNGFIRFFDDNLNLENDNFTEVHLKDSLDLLKKTIPTPKLLLFHPICTATLCTLMLYLIFNLLVKILPLFKSPLLFTNNLCDTECVNIISNIFAMEIFILLANLIPLLIFVDYFLIRIKKIKNIQMHSMLKFAATLMFPIYIMLTISHFNWLIKNNHLRQMYQGYELISANYGGNQTDLNNLKENLKKMIKHHQRKKID